MQSTENHKITDYTDTQCTHSAMIERPFELMMYVETWYLKWDYMYKPVKVNYTCLPSVSNVDNQEVKYW